MTKLTNNKSILTSRLLKNGNHVFVCLIEEEQLVFLRVAKDFVLGCFFEVNLKLVAGRVSLLPVRVKARL